MFSDLALVCLQSTVYLEAGSKISRATRFKALQNGRYIVKEESLSRKPAGNDVPGGGEV